MTELRLWRPAALFATLALAAALAGGALMLAPAPAAAMTDLDEGSECTDVPPWIFLLLECEEETEGGGSGDGGGSSDEEDDSEGDPVADLCSSYGVNCGGGRGDPGGGSSDGGARPPAGPREDCSHSGWGHCLDDWEVRSGPEFDRRVTAMEREWDKVSRLWNECVRLDNRIESMKNPSKALQKRFETCQDNAVEGLEKVARTRKSLGLPERRLKLLFIDEDFEERLGLRNRPGYRDNPARAPERPRRDLAGSGAQAKKGPIRARR